MTTSSSSAVALEAARTRADSGTPPAVAAAASAVEGKVVVAETAPLVVVGQVVEVAEIADIASHIPEVAHHIHMDMVGFSRKQIPYSGRLDFFQKGRILTKMQRKRWITDRIDSSVVLPVTPSSLDTRLDSDIEIYRAAS